MSTESVDGSRVPGIDPAAESDASAAGAPAMNPDELFIAAGGRLLTAARGLVKRDDPYSLCDSLAFAIASLDEYADVRSLDEPERQRMIDCTLRAIIEEEIARLSLLDRADYERQRRNAAKRLGWRASMLDAEIKRSREEYENSVAENTRQEPADDEVRQVGPYRERPHGLSRVKLTLEGEIEVALTNFIARIVADLLKDDGAETARAFEITAQRSGREYRFAVPTASFPSMRWAVEHMGAEAVVYAGVGTADHARCAIQMLSDEVARRTVYAHTGWRRLGEEWIYLHGGGAIGADGPVAGIEVELPPELAPFALSAAEDSREAMRASLRILDLGPDRITVPTYGCYLRSLLGGADFSIFLFGRTGSFKTELAALIQQHFGAGFDARQLPASFTSTGNANEALAFVAKDAVLVIDELHPPSSPIERERMMHEAARVLRAQGNHSGRARMRSDGTLRPVKPPRGLIVATGEEQPRGQSLHARMYTVEVKPGEIDSALLSACQADAAAGLYSQSTAEFVHWLAPHYEQAQSDFRAMTRELRGSFKHGHARTNDVRAQITAAYAVYATFLVESEVITTGEAEELKRRIHAALTEAADAQAGFTSEVEPCSRFAQLLSSAISAGAVHLATRGGSAPAGREAACGWRYEHEAWCPQGDRVGWLEDDDLYLDPNASYRAATRMAADGNGIEASTATLARRLRDHNLLRSRDERRQRLTRRLFISGVSHEVLHVSAEYLFLSIAGEASKPSNIGVEADAAT